MPIFATEDVAPDDLLRLLEEVCGGVASAENIPVPHVPPESPEMTAAFDSLPRSKLGLAIMCVERRVCLVAVKVAEFMTVVNKALAGAARNAAMMTRVIAGLDARVDSCGSGLTMARAVAMTMVRKGLMTPEDVMETARLQGLVKPDADPEGALDTIRNFLGAEMPNGR